MTCDRLAEQRTAPNVHVGRTRTNPNASSPGSGRACGVPGVQDPKPGPSLRSDQAGSRLAWRSSSSTKHERCPHRPHAARCSRGATRRWPAPETRHREAPRPASSAPQMGFDRGEHPAESVIAIQAASAQRGIDLESGQWPRLLVRGRCRRPAGRLPDGHPSSSRQSRSASPSFRRSRTVPVLRRRSPRPIPPCQNSFAGSPTPDS